MNLFKEFLQDNLIKVYHGDNYGLSEINQNYDRINDTSGNMQYGPGIYFTSDKNIAETYGSKIVSTQIDKSKLLPALEYAEDVIDNEKMINLLNYYNSNSEEFWYFYTDFGIEVNDSLEVEMYHHEELANNILQNEVRNLMIELLERVDDTKVFVDG